MIRNILLLALCQALSMTVMSMLLSSAPLIGETLAGARQWATLPVSVQLLATMLATLPASLFMQRRGRRTGFIFAGLVMLLGGLGAALAIYAGSFSGFLISIAALGAAISFFQFFRFAAIDVAPVSHASKAVSWVLFGGLLAAFSGPNLAAWTRLLIPAHPFMATMLSVVPLSLIMLLLFAQMQLPRPAEEDISGRQRPRRTIVRQPVFIVSVVSAMIGYGVMTLLMAATPLAMKGDHFNFGQTAFIIQWHLVGMFAPSFFSGALISRIGPLPVMLSGALAYLLVVALNMQPQSILVYWFALVILGVGWNFLFVGATSLLHDAWLPAEKGHVQGINDTLVFSASALAAMGSGALYANIGWRATNLVSLPLSLLAIALIIFLMLRNRKQQAMAS